MADEEAPYDDDPWGGELPDLASLPPEEWKEAFRPLNSYCRRAVAQRFDLTRGGGAATLVLLDLEHEESKLRRNGPPKPGPPRTTPPAAQDPATRIRQVNLKLQLNEYADLARAAERLGLRPTVLARMLVARGVALTLRA